MYLGRPNLGSKGLTHEEIVYTPAHVPRPGIGEVRPPAVVPVAFGENTKRIHKSRLNKRINTLTLLLCETMFTLIGLRVRQIIGHMRHIEIPAENNRLFLLQLLTKCQKGWVPMLVTK